jgi:hypothetical protein
MPASRKDDGVMFQSHVIANRRVPPSDWRAAVEKDSRRDAEFAEKIMILPSACGERIKEGGKSRPPLRLFSALSVPRREYFSRRGQTDQ